MQTRLAVIDNVTNALVSRPELSNVVVKDVTPPRIVSSMQITIEAFYNSAKSSIDISINHPQPKQLKNWDDSIHWDNNVNWD